MSDSEAILIVEDEYLIATDLAETLLQMGYDVVGPTPSVEGALQLIGSHRVTAAILDIQLNKEQSYPIADELTKLNKPFFFLTSFTKKDLPDRFADKPLLSKLSSPSEISDAIKKLTNTE